MLKIFKATKTLENFNKNLKYTSNKSESELLIVGGKEINLEEFPNLKGIFKTGVGVDNIPFEEAKKRDVLIELPSKETCEIIYNETSSFASHFILNHVLKIKVTLKLGKKILERLLKDTMFLLLVPEILVVG